MKDHRGSKFKKIKKVIGDGKIVCLRMKSTLGSRMTQMKRIRK